MPSERVKRQINALLDEAEQAVKKSDWALVRERADQVLTLDPDNEDGLFYLVAAQRRLGSNTPQSAFGSGDPTPTLSAALVYQTPVAPASAAIPTSFANGRYIVKRFLGEGGKKKVYLVLDIFLNRDAAFALIKLEGLDDTASAHNPRSTGHGQTGRPS